MNNLESLISADIRGLKCDNKECNFEDMSISYEEYPEYVNSECPKCGSNLLTEEDYQSVKTMVENAKMLNRYLLGSLDEEDLSRIKESEKDDNKEYIKLTQELDGTGNQKNTISTINAQDLGKIKGIEDYK